MEVAVRRSRRAFPSVFRLFSASRYESELRGLRLRLGHAGGLEKRKGHLFVSQGLCASGNPDSQPSESDGLQHPGPGLAMTLAAGTRLGSYEILGPLGTGGMGEVYRARDTKLSREVAIKVLPAELSSDAHRLERFEKEARTASALNHPNIVTIYEVGLEGATSFIAMELVAGKTLRELLITGPIPLKRLLAVAAQAADGLAKAHAAGIVHR